MQQRIDFSELAKRLLAGGYTTKRLADEVGLSQPSISRIANGHTKSISADTGIALICLAGGHVHVPPTEASAVKA